MEANGAYAKNVQVIGYCDVRDRPAFKMAVREVHGRWYLYTGHFWHSGWSIIDVSDPERPRLARFIDGPKNTFTLQMTLYGETMLTALEKIFPNFGGEADKPFEEGVLIWDISDPLNPKKLSHWRTGGTGTHRNLYAGGRYAHLAANMAGFRGNIYVILDIGDRENPREAGRWWVPGQKKDEVSDKQPAMANALSSNKYRLKTVTGCACAGFCARPDNDVSLHGPPYVIGTTAYLPYGAAGLIVLDIADVARPREIGRLGFSPPFHSPFGVHSVLPIPERGPAFVNSEDISYGQGPAHHASIVDISDPSDHGCCRSCPSRSRRPKRPTRTSTAEVVGADRTISIIIINIIRMSRSRATCFTSPISTPACASTTSPTSVFRWRPATSFPRSRSGALVRCRRDDWCCRPKMWSSIAAA